MKFICYLVPYRLLLACYVEWIVQVHSKIVGGETRIVHYTLLLGRSLR